MNQPDPRFTKIWKVVDPFWVSGANQDHKRCFIDDALVRKVMPVRGDKAALF